MNLGESRIENEVRKMRGKLKTVDIKMIYFQETLGTNVEYQNSRIMQESKKKGKKKIDRSRGSREWNRMRETEKE